MGESDARIEPATADDVDAVTDMWVALAAGQREHGATLRAEANRATVREWVAQSVVTGELLVARDPDSAADTDGEGVASDEGTAVGFVGFALERGDYERDAVRGTVSNLYVIPERRGEGIGAALLDAAERELAEAGADHVALEALADNDRAREFYAERGYGPHRVELTKSLDDSASDSPAAESADAPDESG
jgi:ribosomal protein S18 acetylase RimI-like enzyme